MKADDDLRLSVRRLIPASAERLFEAWTTPSQLQCWWGPRDVRCSHAQIDARVGGHYRIDNVLPDGRILVIAGEFLVVDSPTELVYTWGIEPHTAAPELVTVRFEPRGEATEVVVTHERIGDQHVRDQHAAGWNGCLDGPAEYAAADG